MTELLAMNGESSRDEVGMKESDIHQMINIGWWEADIKNKCFLCSDNIVERMGLSSKTITFDTFINLIHKDYQEQAGFDSLTLQQLYTYDETFPIKTVHGYSWIRAKSEYKPDSNKSKQSIKGYIQYLSAYKETKKHEEQTQSVVINRNDSYLYNISQYIPAGIELYNKDGFLQDINENALKILGFPQKENVLGNHIYEHPFLTGSAKNELRNGRGCCLDIDYTNLLTTPKEIKKLNIKGTVLRDKNDDIGGYMLVSSDNTATSNTFQRIREFEDFFTYIAEFAGIGVYKWNPIKQTGFAIEQWFKNMNEEKRNLKDIISIYKSIHSDDRQIIQNFYRDIFRGKASDMQAEIRVKNGDDWKWVRCILKIKEFDLANNNLEIVGLNYDITESKKTEAKLIEAKIKAEESDRLKSAFLANMSHEIRTPLNAIVGFSAVIADVDDQDAKQQYLSIIQNNSEQLLQLISDILDFSKIEAGIFEIKYNDIEVNELCSELIQTFVSKIPSKVVLIFEKHLPTLTINSDKKRITQVLSNFIHNAIKFTSQGNISIGYNVSESNVEFYVRDTGIGIAPEYIGTIFDRFVQVNHFFNGTGLGLSICRSIIENMGGEIGVNSIIGQGSRFWFRLPCAPQ